MSRLDPIEPDMATQMYLSTREGELRSKTLTSQRYRLLAFTRWCRAEGIENMNDLDGRTLHSFRACRRTGFDDYDEEYMAGYDPLEPQTLHNHLSTLRVFLRFCAQIDAVPEELPEKIILPRVTESQQVSDTTLDPNRAEEILSYLDRYHYASRKHVTALLLWHLGCRAGGLRAIDLEDLDLEGSHPKVDGPAIHIVHRPETGTPLKNGDKATRWNAINHYVAQTVEDYVQGPRKDVTDEYGREPLLTTTHGRPRTGTIRNTAYWVSRPCWYDNSCPHDKDIESCEWTEYNQTSQCPSSRSPHDFRSGSLTRHLLEGTPKDVTQDRMNLSEKVLDRHYDRRTAREKMEQRRRYLPK
ncbi:tyrosine-type recombinase/integrase [Haloarchaeobius sp. TZWSO28]|uniref:tyrosine-type recombinase/integrase n=1 Tax=Haloarchaeobius sp. TZWSO28 TaxID=3446119 RepID=UPI003EBC52BE